MQPITFWIIIKLTFLAIALYHAYCDEPMMVISTVLVGIGIKCPKR